MRIVHTESHGRLGGQNLRLIEEAESLTARGHECTVVGPRGSALEEAAEGRIRFEPFRFLRGSLNPLNIARAWHVLARLRPDVLHTHSSRDAWAFGVPARALGIPIVRGRHVLRPVRRGPLSRVAYTHLADAFTASGESIKQALVEGGVAGPEDVFVTPGGLDFTRFNPEAVDRDYLRRELGLGPESVLVGTACMVRWMKGVDVLLDAQRVLGRSDVHVVHAGNDDQGYFATRWEHPPEDVHPLGFRSDIVQVLGGLDRFVLSSRSHEGVPNSLTQAMGLGLPVVATAAGGIPDLVEDGVTGILVPPEDPAALADGIRRSLEMEPAELDAMCARALAKVRRDYSLEAVVDRYLAAYEKVLGEADHALTGTA